MAVMVSHRQTMESLAAQHHERATAVHALIVRSAELEQQLAQSAQRLSEMKKKVSALTGAWLSQAGTETELAYLRRDLSSTPMGAPSESAAEPHRCHRDERPGEMSGTPVKRQNWDSNVVDLALPLDLVETMWTRAERWDRTSGGRYHVAGSSILIWSGAHRSSSPQRIRPEILGYASLRWQAPSMHEATIARIAWKPERGGSAVLVWHSLEVLAGTALVP